MTRQVNWSPTKRLARASSATQKRILTPKLHLAGRQGAKDAAKVGRECRAVQAGHRRQEVHGGTKGTERVSDARFNGGASEGIDLGQMQLQHEPMMLGQASMERIDDIGARLCLPKTPSVENAFEISDIHEEQAETGPKSGSDK